MQYINSFIYSIVCIGLTMIPAQASPTTDLLDLTSIYQHLRFYHGNNISSNNWDRYLLWAVEEVMERDNKENDRAFWNNIISPVLKKTTINQESVCHDIPSKREVFYWLHSGPGMASDFGFPLNLWMPYRSVLKKIKTTDTIQTKLTIPLSKGFYWHYSILGTKQRQFLNHQKDIQQIRLDRKLEDVHNTAYILASLIKVWATYETFYPQFSYLDISKEIDFKPLLEAAFEVQSISQYYHLLERLLHLFKDGHALIANNFGKGIFLRYYPMHHLPFRIKIDAQGRAFVSAIMPTYLGIKLQDELLAINQSSMLDIFERVKKQLSASTPQELNRRLEDRLPNVFSTDSIALTLRRGDSIISLKVLPVSNFYTDSDEENTLASYFSNQEQSLFLDMSLITYKEFKQLEPQLHKKRYVICDMRERPFYDFSKIISHFTRDTLYSDHLCTATSYHPKVPPQWNCEQNVIVPHKRYYDCTLIFIIGANTYSYGETCLSLVKDTNIGVIVGSPTSGTNGNTILVNLPICSIFMTGMKVNSKEGKDIWWTGIQPDYSLEINAANDVIYKAVQKIIKNLK